MALAVRSSVSAKVSAPKARAAFGKRHLQRTIACRYQRKGGKARNSALDQRVQGKTFEPPCCWLRRCRAARPLWSAALMAHSWAQAQTWSVELLGPASKCSACSLKASDRSRAHSSERNNAGRERERRDSGQAMQADWLGAVRGQRGLTGQIGYAGTEVPAVCGLSADHGCLHWCLPGCLSLRPGPKREERGLRWPQAHTPRCATGARHQSFAAAQPSSSAKPEQCASVAACSACSMPPTARSCSRNAFLLRVSMFVEPSHQSSSAAPVLSAACDCACAACSASLAGTPVSMGAVLVRFCASAALCR